MTHSNRNLLLYVVVTLNLLNPKTILASLSEPLDQTLDTSLTSSQEIPMSQEAHKNAKIFISYSSQDNELVHKFVNDLQTNLKFSDNDILFDEKNYAGRELNIPEFIDNIFYTSYVVIVGSVNFKEKYVNKKKYAGSIVRREINNILQRRTDRGDKGLIPIWFQGDHRQCFPSCLRDLTAINFANNYEIQFERLKKSFSTGRPRVTTLRRNYLRRWQSDNTACLVPKTLPAISAAESLSNKRTIAMSSNDNQNSPSKRRYVNELLLGHIKSLKSSNLLTELQQFKPFHKVIYDLPDRQPYFPKNSRYEDSATYLDILKDELDFTPTLEVPKSYNKVILTGMGGIGKTALAKAFAYRALDASAYELIYWLNSTTTDHLRQSFKNLLSILKINYDDQASITDLSKLVKLNIVPYSWLFIYDGAPYPRFLDDCIPQFGGHVLITSRCCYDWNALNIKLYPFHDQDAVEYLINFRNLEKSAITREQAQLMAQKLFCSPLLLHQASNNIEHHKISFKDFYNELDDNVQLSSQLAVNTSHTSPKFDYSYLIDQTWQQADQMMTNATKYLITCCAYLDYQTILGKYFGHIKPLNSLIQTGFTQLDDFCLIDKGKKFITIHPSLQYVITFEERQKDYSSVDETPIFNLLKNFKQYVTIAINQDVANIPTQQIEFSEFAPWLQKHLSTITDHINTLEKRSITQIKFINAYRSELSSIHLLLNNYVQ